MSHRQIRQLLFFVGGMLCFSLPTMAIAHVGGHETAGFWYGFQHPLGGLDHLIAMLAVGIWAVQLEDKQARIFLPLSFLGLMLLGGLLGMVGMALPGIEVGIIFSDLLLGCLIFFGARLPVAWSSLIIGALAVFHGYAHGAEMPANAQSVQYALGFLSGTASLHLIGMGAAFLAQRRQQVQFFRIAGAMMVLAGFTVFAQSL